jgi:hypothetical protein
MITFICLTITTDIIETLENSNICMTSAFFFQSGVVTELTFFKGPIALLIRNSSFFPSSPPHQKQNSSLLPPTPPNYIYEG